MVAVSRVLYVLVGSLDGKRDLDDLAHHVSTRTGRLVAPEDIAYLVDHKLRPLGIVDGEARAPSMSPLALRRGVVPDRAVLTACRLFRWLFTPVVVAGALGALFAVEAWLILTPPTMTDVGKVLGDGGLLLLVAWLTVAGGAFHELGHATACHVGGARPGRIGIGIYLVWPVFFSDLNDSYRLGRAGRLRADLGGVYFNGVFIVGLAGAYAITASPVLPLVIVLHNALVVRQFIPFLRLDGYYIVTDLTGVPNLFAHVRPTLRRLAGHARRPVRDTLRPHVRAVVTVWVVATTALTVALLVLLVIALPGLVEKGAGFAASQWALVLALLNDRNLEGLLGAVRLAALAIVVAGLSRPLLGLVRLAVRSIAPDRPGAGSPRTPREGRGSGRRYTARASARR